MHDVDRIRLGLEWNDRKKRPIDLIIMAFVSLLSVPFFINLQSFELFIRHTQRDGYLQGGMGGIPFPVFGSLLVMVLLIVASLNIKGILRQLRTYDVFLLVSLFVFLVLSFVSRYSLTEIVQLLMVPVLLGLGSFFAIDGKLGRYFLYGSAVFVSLHLFSIISLNGWTLSRPFLRYIVYESIFYYQIYQGLISYVNVLTICGVMLLYVLFKQERLWKAIIIGFFLSLVLYVASLSSQRSFALDLIVISGLVLFASITRNAIAARNKWTGIVAVLLAWALSLFAVNNDSGDTGIGRLVKTFDRISDAAAISGLPSGGEQKPLGDGLERVSHVFETMDSLKTTMEGDKFAVLFKGTGNVHSGSHNFILDMVSGAGVIGALFFFVFALGAAWRLVGPVMKGKKAVPVAFIVAMSLMMFLGSMVNSPMTQPYYFLNFMFIAWIVVSDSVEQDRGSNK